MSNVIFKSIVNVRKNKKVSSLNVILFQFTKNGKDYEYIIIWNKSTI